jgi:hypothetical protein
MSATNFLGMCYFSEHDNHPMNSTLVDRFAIFVLKLKGSFFMNDYSCKLAVNFTLPLVEWCIFWGTVCAYVWG